MDSFVLVHIIGRLGNQLFHTAFLLYLMRKFKRAKTFKLSFLPYTDAGEAEAFSRIFPKAAPLLLPSGVYEMIGRLPASAVRRVSEESFGCFQEIEEGYQSVQSFYGCWQVWQYVRDNEKLLRRIFTFDSSRLSDPSRRCLEQIESTLSVSLHVRRGDYEDDLSVRYVLGRICTEAYYREAVARMQRETGGKPLTLFVFSDDPQWVRSNMDFGGCETVYVDWNTGADTWQDMCLMSRCRHHIIPNSTFSWWGAWLNASPAKKVIAPAVWYNTRPVPDILLPEWIALPVPPLWSEADYGELTVLLPLDVRNERHCAALVPLLRYLLAFRNIRVMPVWERPAAVTVPLPDAVRPLATGSPYGYTEYINTALDRVDTPYTAVWNADCLVSPLQWEEAWRRVREDDDCLVVPYTQQAFEVKPEGWEAFCRTGDYRSVLRNAVSAEGEWSKDNPVFMIRTNDYIRAGKENGNLSSVRYAARERAKRMERCGVREVRVYGALHLRDTGFVFDGRAEQNDLSLYLKTCETL